MKIPGISGHEYENSCPVFFDDFESKIPGSPELYQTSGCFSIDFSICVAYNSLKQSRFDFGVSKHTLSSYTFEVP